MKWVTRERPKIDRSACPWLVARFIDPAIAKLALIVRAADIGMAKPNGQEAA